MKIKIGHYDVSISAKADWQDKASKQSTLAFLNYLSSVFVESAEYNKGLGFEGICETQRKEGRDLYNICDENHLYDDIRNIRK